MGLAEVASVLWSECAAEPDDYGTVVTLLLALGAFEQPGLEGLAVVEVENVVLARTLPAGDSGSLGVTVHLVGIHGSRSGLLGLGNGELAVFASGVGRRIVGIVRVDRLDALAGLELDRVVAGAAGAVDIDVSGHDVEAAVLGTLRVHAALYPLLFAVVEDTDVTDGVGG